MKNKLVKENILYIAFGIALISALGSLYFSEVLHFIPCVLCWYQRIFMYPLVIILGVGILGKDKKVYRYVLPLSILGLLVSIYQNFLYYDILSEAIYPCTIGASCIARFISLLGFIDIPLLSLFSFTLITVCMLIYRKIK